MPLIVIEGVDGTGKTTVGSILSVSHGLKVLETPTEPYYTIKQSVLEKESHLAKFLFFMASNISLSDQIKLYDKNEIIVCVRYLWSTIAYTIAFMDGVCSPEVATISSLIKDTVLFPKLVIIFNTDDKNLEERYQRKANGEYYCHLTDNLLFSNKLKSAYQQSFEIVPTKTVSIDTSEIDANEVAKLVIEHIKDIT